MAKGMNRILLIGLIARDPELRYTPSGVPVFEATVAGEDHLMGSDGRERKLPWYHRVSLLGKPAEWLAERNLKAGEPVVVEGGLEYSQWEAPEGGKRSQVRVKAMRVESLAEAFESIGDAGGGVRMAGGTNSVQLIGNLSRDAELRYTPGGDAVVGLSLAVNESWKDRNGQVQEKTHWIDVTLWRELAESAKDLKKGDPVLVQGRLTNESWTDKDGNKRNSTKVEASVLHALSRRSGGAPRTATPAEKREPVAAGAGKRSGGLDIDQGLQDFPPDGDDLPF